MSLGAQDREEEKLPPARQNPLLREHFRGRLDEIGLFKEERRLNDAFMERFIDRQIDHYLSQLRQKLDLLKTHFAEVERAGKAMREATCAEKIQEARVRYRDALEEVQDQAGSLRSLLGYVLAELKSKNDFKPQIDKRAKDSAFEKETQFIGEQIAKAEERIHRYFFESNNTIRL
ncbi:hypothetical protein MYX65_02530, partial [Acidobacteria bacterium AH-259-L09]|nr:hypothetical protein [Acidobacteria bacterium AH-259-L09]